MAKFNKLQVLVSDYLRAYPVDGNFLTEEAINFTVRQILILQSGMSACSPHHWAEGVGCELAACIFVLLVEENLVNSRDKILGMRVDEVYDMLSSLLHACSISREELITRVTAVDIEGTATWLASTPEFDVIWAEVGQPRILVSAAGHVQRATWLHQVLTDLGRRKDEYRSLLTTAALTDIRRTAGTGSAGLDHMRHVIGKRLFIRSASVLIVAIAFWLFFSITARPWLGEDLLALLAFGFAVTMTLTFLASFFPKDLISSFGRPVMSLLTGLAVIGGGYHAHSEWLALPSHPSSASQTAHALFIASALAVWMSGLILAVIGRLSWGAMHGPCCSRAWKCACATRTLRTHPHAPAPVAGALRLLLATDGILYALAAAALSQLGRPQRMCYPPGSSSHPVAIPRAVLMLLAAAYASLDVRRRIASFTGLGHVQLHLKELSQAQLRRLKPGAADARSDEGSIGSGSSILPSQPLPDGVRRGSHGELMPMPMHGLQALAQAGLAHGLSTPGTPGLTAGAAGGSLGSGTAFLRRRQSHSEFGAH